MCWEMVSYIWVGQSLMIFIFVDHCWSFQDARQWTMDSWTVMYRSVLALEVVAESAHLTKLPVTYPCRCWLFAQKDAHLFLVICDGNFVATRGTTTTARMQRN